MKVKITKILMVVMINNKKNLHESVVGILTMMSLQSSLQQKGRRHLIQLLRIMESQFITEIISSTMPEEPKNRILLFIMPMQDSKTVT
jgi:hypothetical protein